MAAPAMGMAAARKAEVGLVAGGTTMGFVTRFEPTDADLVLHQGTRRVSVAAERVAFVRLAQGGRSRHHGSVPARVHVVGGEVVEILVDPDRWSSPLGFGASSAEGDAELFFYAHGVLAKERAEPLGRVLVDQGSLSTQELARGVDVQADQKSTPLGAILVEQASVSREQVDAASELQKRRKMRIGEILVEEGFATDRDIEVALAEQKQRRGKRLGEVLVSMGAITEVDLALALANKFSLEFIDLEEVAPAPRVLREVPRAAIEKYRVLPIRSDDTSLTVALADPLHVEAIEAIRMLQPKKVIEVLATKSQLEQAVASFLDRGEMKTQQGFDALVRAAASEEDLDADESDDVDASDSAVIKLVNQVIIDGYRQGASDIHIEPNGRRHTTRIRFRVDGQCSTYREVPPPLRAPLVARLKIMAKLDIAERRKPQDGKIKFRIQDKQIELRVATIPTVANNEDVVMRILANAKPLPLREMGLSPRNLEALREAIEKPYGLILCVGPTGSGKTTTLHSTLGARNREGTKIWTAEDPVEITQLGLRQVQVHPRIGFTFAAALRAFLRADPDIIMVDEMRDLETASMAVEASLTGHLVFSTLHTNSAPETVTRLVDMGLDPFSFSDALVAVLAQRLVRRLCDRCRESYEPCDQAWQKLVGQYGELHLDADLGGRPRRLWRARGCRRCGDSGYRGRLAIHELLVSDDTIIAAIQQKAPAEEIRQVAMASGMRTLLQDGIQKAMRGDTDLTQILGVCSR